MDDRRELLGELMASAAAAEDFGTAFFAAAERFRDAAEEHFASDGSGQWPAWSDSYASRRAGGRLMVESGDLLKSFADAGSPHHIRRITAAKLEVGSSKSMANYHRGSGPKLPRRDPMPPLELFEQDWIDGLGAHIGVGGGTVSATIGM